MTDSTPGPERPEFLTIGTITAPHGLRGAVKVFAHTDWPERFAGLLQVYLGSGGVPREEPRDIQVIDASPRQILLHIEGIDDRDEAEAMRGVDLLIPVSEAWPLPQGHYYHFELLGMEVYDQHGTLRGRLSRIYPGSANDFYAVTSASGGAECLLPAIHQVVVGVDLANRRMTVVWQEWSEPTDASRGTGQ